MKKSLVVLCSCLSSFIYLNAQDTSAYIDAESMVVAFGSCNKVDLPNPLWDAIREDQPDVWIWGGDNIYADTKDMVKMRNMYKAQDRVKGYRKLKRKTEVIGTWDDHDYGINDGGALFEMKAESQQAFLDFFDVPPDSPRRSREGIYASHLFTFPSAKVKIIILDTRYFRSPLKPDPTGRKRYIPHTDGKGTVLGEIQWEWLQKELDNSAADFNLIVSSIQFLSAEHGFETWGNFPHEVERMKRIIASSGARGVIFLSGDRHLTEFSKTFLETLSYPLVDFTSSGLTHAYRDFSGEPNKYRVGKVISTESYGLLHLNFVTGEVVFQAKAAGGEVLASWTEAY